MRRSVRKKIIKRGRMTFILFAVVIALLCGRLVYIQLIAGPALAETAARQQMINLVGADGRAFIYDRNMTPLTGINREYVYIIKKDGTPVQAVANILAALDATPVSGASKGYYVYAGNTYDKQYADLLVARYGAYIFECDRRYSDNQAAAHVIGYINPYDNTGVSGIEEELNDLLSSAERKTYVYADRDGRILAGAGSVLRGTEAAQDIVLTIDMRMQAALEEILAQTDKNCAAVIVDCGSGEILAMASTPVYNPNNVAAYIRSEKAELLNKVTQGEYPPGSIFKLVVAAAALETGAIDMNSTFYCTGSEKFGNIEIGCSTGGEDGHGEINLKDAFAYSCNSAFIQIGKRVGAEDIIEMAEAMGLGEAPLRDIPNIRSGHVTESKDAQGAGIGNLSIGQGSMLVTPLQVARLTNIIANSGNDIELSLIKNSDDIAAVSSAFAASYTKRTVRSNVISAETARQVRYLMKLTAQYGTAAAGNSSLSFAGKTGSAEDGETVHGWFTGFTPAQKPRYTITVFVEEGKSGRASAVPIFNEITAALSRIDQ